jgi:hypothetical protein
VYMLRAAMLWYQNPVKSPEQIVNHSVANGRAE